MKHIRPSSYIASKASAVFLRVPGYPLVSVTPASFTIFSQFYISGILTSHDIVSHVMFWNLGIFLLVDVFQRATKDLDDSIEQQSGPIIRKYQQDAASCVAQVVECVLDLPAEEAFNLQNGLGAEVPITAYHVTPSLAVTALQKAIESVINLQIYWTGQSGLAAGDGQMLILDGIWDRQIDILMKGLMSLDVTIGGSQTCWMALRELMQKHGDILSECWTSRFDT